MAWSGSSSRSGSAFLQSTQTTGVQVLNAAGAQHSQCSMPSLLSGCPILPSLLASLLGTHLIMRGSIHRCRHPMPSFGLTSRTTCTGWHHITAAVAWLCNAMEMCHAQGLSLRPKAEANLGGGLVGRNGRTPFQPRSRQKLRPQGAISAAGADACETDMGRFRPVGSGAAGLGLAAAASLAEGLGTDFSRHGRRVWKQFQEN
jgi:hypothetical protein